MSAQRRPGQRFHQLKLPRGYESRRRSTWSQQVWLWLLVSRPDILAVPRLGWRACAEMFSHAPST